MEKIIKIDLDNKDDFFEKYNKNVVSKSLINYIIEQAILIEKNVSIKLVVNNKCNLEDKELELIKDGLELEYRSNLKYRDLTNLKQIILLIIGIIFLFLSAVMKEGFIFKEVFLIVGWVPIWEVIDIELFTDVEERRKRKVLKKLLESNFEIIK